jgi:chemotaxis protein methyltransferase CheR
MQTLTALCISDDEMLLFQNFFKHHIGIYIPLRKKALLCHRLSQRVRQLGLQTLREYYALLILPQSAVERQMAFDLMTTNETCFFREEQHFIFLQQHILPTLPRDIPVLIWSAASASGEEAYSLAMMMADVVGGGQWEVHGTDISERVLVYAQRALYPLSHANRIPAAYLNHYCLCGTGEYEGYFLIHQAIRQHVRFHKINLLDVDVEVRKKFDIIFLRNVTIYFDDVTKAHVIRAVLRKLKPGGYLFVGPSETLHGLDEYVEICAPSIYRRL